MLRGKAPSLIGSSLGRPKSVMAGKLCACGRCKSSIRKGDQCFDVPQLARSFSNTRRFCSICFASVLQQTRSDLAQLEALLQTISSREAAPET